MQEIRYRNLVLVAILSVVTAGIYLIYWFVRTKSELNSLGAKIPTAWLLLLFPIGTLYWLYKYAEGVHLTVGKDNAPLLWFYFILSSFAFSVVAPLIVQERLNQVASGEAGI